MEVGFQFGAVSAKAGDFVSRLCCLLLGVASAASRAVAQIRPGLGGAFSADGATGTLTAESVSIDARGNETVSRTVIDRGNKTVYRLTYAPGSTVAALSTTVDGLLVSSRSTSGLVTTYAYDALGRMTASQDARGGVRSRGYDGLGRVAWESDPATNGTWYAYDDLGRRTAVTNALGEATETAYDAEGRPVATWGATYPVAYEYDFQGRMTAMYTYRGTNEISSQSEIENLKSQMDRTTWSYDQPTGLLTNKVYADGKGTAYTYTPDGKLATRAWARGVTTTYTYTNGSSLAAIDYSDDTPDVAFTYDRLGRMTSAIIAGVSTNTYAYDPETLALSVETQNGAVIARDTDALGRPAGFSLSGSPYAVSYAYDAYGRFSAVTAQVHVLTHGYVYGYLADSDLVETMANTHGHTVTRTYDPVMPYITRVHNGYTGGRTVSQYDYTYDALGRRTAVANSGEAFSFSNANDLAAFNLYGYNGRSEVTSAARYWGTDTEDTSEAVDGQQYAYAFDPIGNRVTAAEGDTSRTATYTANELNQYAQRTVPGVKELAGTALAEATVTVNDLPTDRHGPWWRHAFEADNGSSAAYTQAVVTAVYSNLYSSATGHVFVAETPEAFAYDYDGNLTQDGRFDYAWDAENRLASATTRDDLPAGVPRVRVTHRYDHQSRRIATERETWAGSAWQPAGTNRYLYDGWNVVAETRSASPANTNLYVWGLDLSGSLQGAGGIGGLLTVRKRLEDGTGIVRNYDYLFDANGNVVQEILRTDGTINAHYEYDPFGAAVIALRVDATDNPFRFSTKWFDNDTGLGYWGYRWYSPGLGRWLSRDPIGERGGHHLYSFVKNEVIVLFDIVGLRPCCVCCNAYKDDYIKEPIIAAMINALSGRRQQADPKKPKCLGTITCDPNMNNIDPAAYNPNNGNISFACDNKACAINGGQTDTGSSGIRALLLHELQHAFDYCWKEWEGCDGLLCVEFRAHYCAKECTSTADCRAFVKKRFSGSTSGSCKDVNDADLEKKIASCGDVKDIQCHGSTIESHPPSTPHP